MSASDIRAGKAYVEIYSRDNTAPGMKAIFNRLGNFAFQIQNIGGLVARVGGAASRVVTGAANYGSGIQDAADRTGMTAEAVQELGFAAAQSGASIESLETGIKMMQKALATGSDGVGDTLAQIGVSLADIRGLSPDQQFMAIAQAISGIQDPAERTRLAMALFGRSGAELIPLLNQGSAGIEQLREKARALGLVLSASEVAALEQFGDELDVLYKQFEILTVKVGIALLPAFEELLNALENTIPVLLKYADALRIVGEAAAFSGGIPLGNVDSFAEWLVSSLFGVDKPNANKPQKTKQADIAELQAELQAELGRSPSFKGGFGAVTLEGLMSMEDYQKQAVKELKELNAQVKKKRPGAPGLVAGP